MPGFFVSNKESNVSMREIDGMSYIFDTIHISNGGVVKRNTIRKFLDDKTFIDTGKIIIIIEGYLLNKKKLFGKYNVESLASLVESMYVKVGESFFREFKGCFSGALFDKTADKWIVYTNQIGDNPIFYLCNQGIFAAGSQICYLLDFCKEKKIQLSYCESCAYQMLTYGYVANDETYANEIKRLHGGDYIVYQNNMITVKSYHRFEKNLTRFEGKSEHEIIDEIDKVFREAVALEWDKDNEYGYKHLADLSGGLDSRMNMWIAHEMSNKHMSLLTYCKKDYLDETIARQIANFWNDEVIFKPLDDVDFMYDIEENTFMLNGLSFYSAITGGKRLLSSVDFGIYGIEHTGMVGDIALGSFYRDVNDGEKKWLTGMYSSKLIRKLGEKVQRLSEDYFDYEIFLMYVRGFHFACNTHLIRRYYTEVGSPFLYVDFLQTCFDIPVQLRIDHYIYKKWIIAKYPEAANFKWEKTGGKITESSLRTNVRRIVKKGPNKILRILGMDEKIVQGMNPIDYWLSKDEDLRLFLDTYFYQTMPLLKNFCSDELSNDIRFLYESGNSSEKAMALTVLAASKMYFE